MKPYLIPYNEIHLINKEEYQRIEQEHL